MLRRILPTSLYGRAFLIIVTPVVIIQSLVTFIFFRSHWDQVTRNLSASVAGDIASVVSVYDEAEGTVTFEELAQIAHDKMDLSVDFKPVEVLPEAVNRSIFSVLDATLERELARRIDRPFWFDTTSYPAYVEVRVQYDHGILKFFPLRERVFATNGHIFLIWLIGVSLTILAVALHFLRTQVRPIQQLAHAAEEFGRGRDAPDYRPAGASEVRQAGRAFVGMRERIKRHIQQHTEMLAGVSHDLRTPLTRMKLELALLDQTEEILALQSDVVEMERMLEEYLSFARGEDVGAPMETRIADIVEAVGADAARAGRDIDVEIEPDLSAKLRAGAVKRAVQNLVSNALAHAKYVSVTARRTSDMVEIVIDDDGPGIPPEKIEDAFKPFNRLDESRNANKSGVGLGLSVARDIARNHGGDVKLSKAEIGGLRAALRIPA